MTSTTIGQLSPAQLDALALDALGASVGSVTKLADGAVTTVWRLDLDDGRQVVLKAGPPPGPHVPNHARHLLRTEAAVYRLAAPAGLPMPALLRAGFDDPVLNGDYLILSALDGTPWNRVPTSPDEDAALRLELGRHLARLHRVPGGDVFGRPHAGLTGRHWREAFLVLTGATLDDAVRYGVALPASIVEIAGILHANAGVLDEVATPSLVHFDVRPGNVFLTGDRRLQALIGHERAFWGDPLADFVTPTAFEELHEDDPLVTGYRDAGGRLALTPEAQIRITLYRIYLYLMLLVRNDLGRHPEESGRRVRDLAARSLARCLDALRPRSPAGAQR